MKALVTGAAGNVGSTLCERLSLNYDYDVYALDNLERNNYEHIRKLRKKNLITFFREDVTDKKAMYKIFNAHQFDVVFHEAALVGVPDSFKDPERYMHTNYQGTVNVFHEAVNSGVKKFIHASSSSVYGCTPPPFYEDISPMQPVSPYGLSKAMGDLYVRSFPAPSMQTIVLRYCDIYGPRVAWLGEHTTVVMKFIRQALDNETITIHGDGSQIRRFTYVEDIVSANIALAEFDFPISKNPYIFNIGGVEKINLRDLATLIIELTGSSSKIEYTGSFRQGDVVDVCSDCSLVTEVTNWSPSFEFREGLSRTIAELAKKK